MGKQRAFLAAHAAPDLHNDVLFVIGVLGQQQDLQLFKKRFLLRFCGGEGLLAQLLHFGIRHQLLGVQHLLFRSDIGVVSLHNGLQVAFLPQQLGRQIGV